MRNMAQCIKSRPWVHEDCDRRALKTEIHTSGVTVKATVSPTFLQPMSGLKLFSYQSHTLCTSILRISVCVQNAECVIQVLTVVPCIRAVFTFLNNLWCKSKLVLLV
jgi:hypothetical protein